MTINFFAPTAAEPVDGCKDCKLSGCCKRWDFFVILQYESFAENIVIASPDATVNIVLCRYTLAHTLSESDWRHWDSIVPGSRQDCSCHHVRRSDALSVLGFSPSQFHTTGIDSQNDICHVLFNRIRHCRRVSATFDAARSRIWNIRHDCRCVRSNRFCPDVAILDRKKAVIL